MATLYNDGPISGRLLDAYARSRAWESSLCYIIHYSAAGSKHGPCGLAGAHKQQKGNV